MDVYTTRTCTLVYGVMTALTLSWDLKKKMGQKFWGTAAQLLRAIYTADT